MEWCEDEDTARAAELLYGHISNMELYPGLQAGKSFTKYHFSDTPSLQDLTDRFPQLQNVQNHLSREVEYALDKQRVVGYWMTQCLSFEATDSLPTISTAPL